MCNASSEDTVITLRGGDLSWKADQCLDLTDERKGMRIERNITNESDVPIVETITKGMHRRYRLDMFPIPDDYWLTRHGLEVSLQLSVDGNIYLLYSNGDRPAKKLPIQPSKFPITPF